MLPGEGTVPVGHPFSITCVPRLLLFMAAFSEGKGIPGALWGKVLQELLSSALRTLFLLGLARTPPPVPQVLPCLPDTRSPVTAPTCRKVSPRFAARWRGSRRVSQPGCSCPGQGARSPPWGHPCVWHFPAWKWPFLLPFGRRFPLQCSGYQKTLPNFSSSRLGTGRRGEAAPRTGSLLHVC